MNIFRLKIGRITSLVMSLQNFFVSCSELSRGYTVWGSQSENLPDVSCVKSIAKEMIWGAMGVSGLSNLHIVPTGKTVDSS